MVAITDMRAVIVDYRADVKIITSLEKIGYKVIPSVNNTNVSLELSGHPDMQICKCGDNIFVCAPECYEYYRNTLSSFGVTLICGKTTLGCNYPCDIAYNVAWIGDIAVCNVKHTDSVVIDTLIKNGIKVVDVAQGYSKCNVCIVNDNSAITSDFGVSKPLADNGIDVLLVEKGNIDIIGWEYGFIGGASGKISDDKLAFCGNLSLHPDYKKMIDFCTVRNVECISLSDKRLTDTGSLILV